MSDWLGLIFILVLAASAAVGLKMLSKPKTRTTEEFERNAAEGTTMMGATMNALQEAIDPESAKAKIVVTEMKEGRYQKKKREGKAEGDTETSI
jgi:hypothetical protein